MWTKSLGVICAAGALAVAIGLFGPARCEAQGIGAPTFDGGVVAAIVVPTAAAGLWTLGLTIADIVSFATGSPWDDGWAAVDIITAVPLIAGSVAFIVAGASLASSNEAHVGYGIAALSFGVFGGFLLGHGIWSLAHNDAPAARAWSPYVAPMEGGATAGVGGVF